MIHKTSNKPKIPLVKRSAIMVAKIENKLKRSKLGNDI